MLLYQSPKDTTTKHNMVSMYYYYIIIMRDYEEYIFDKQTKKNIYGVKILLCHVNLPLNVSVSFKNKKRVKY